MAEDKVVGEICEIFFVVYGKRLGRSDEAMLFENSERIIVLRNRQGVGKGDGSLTLGRGSLEKAKIDETIINFFGKAIFFGVFVTFVRNFTIEVNISGIARDIEAEIGNVIATILEWRIGIGHGRGVGKFDGDLMGDFVAGEGYGVVSLSRNISVGFVGTEIGFN